MEHAIGGNDPPLNPISDAVCSRCRKMVPFGVFFCPHCGTVSLQNMLIKGSTTAHDESQNDKNRRPWKELPPPKLFSGKDKNITGNMSTIGSIGGKKNSLLSKSSSVMWSSEDKPAWVPTMKQPSKKQKKIFVKRLVNEPTSLSSVEVYSSNIIYIDGTPYMKVESSENAPKNIDGNTEILNGAAGIEGPIGVAADAAVAVAPITVAPPAAPKLIWTDTVHPLAVYDATWLSNSLQDSNRDSTQEISIHISLLERKLNNNRSQFWLRIGSVRTNGDEESELEVLGLISNDVGRLLTPADRDWVDLETISPNEHYVVTYLQNILIFIAQRVLYADRVFLSSMRNNKDVMGRRDGGDVKEGNDAKDGNEGRGGREGKNLQIVNIDQYCIVGTSHNSKSSRFVRVEMREEEAHKLRCKSDPACSDEKIDIGSNQNDTIDMIGNKIEESEESSEESLHMNCPPLCRPLIFSDCLSQVTCRVPLGKHLSSVKVTVIARLSVVYSDQDPLVTLPPTFDPSLYPSLPPHSSGPSSVKRKSENDRIKQSETEKNEKNGKTVKFEDDKVDNMPGNEAEEGNENSPPKGSKTLYPNMYQAKVTHLKVFVTPMYPKAVIGRKVIIFEVSSLPYLLGITDADAILSQTHKEVSLLLQNLCGVLRYAHTTHGVKLVVVGATLSPEHMYVAADPPLGVGGGEDGDDRNGDSGGEDGDEDRKNENDVTLELDAHGDKADRGEDKRKDKGEDEGDDGDVSCLHDEQEMDFERAEKEREEDIGGDEERGERLEKGQRKQKGEKVVRSERIVASEIVTDILEKIVLRQSRIKSLEDKGEDEGDDGDVSCLHDEQEMDFERAEKEREEDIGGEEERGERGEKGQRKQKGEKVVRSERIVASEIVTDILEKIVLRQSRIKSLDQSLTVEIIENGIDKDVHEMVEKDEEEIVKEVGTVLEIVVEKVISSSIVI